MYAPRGFGLSEVGDVEIFPHGDELHLFHLTLPNHDVVQHVVSSDGLSWRTLPNALRTGEPGDCDDDQIWTMSVSEHDGLFRMLYTALDATRSLKPIPAGTRPIPLRPARCRGAIPNRSGLATPGTPPSMHAPRMGRSCGVAASG